MHKLPSKEGLGRFQFSFLLIHSNNVPNTKPIFFSRCLKECFWSPSYLFDPILFADRPERSSERKNFKHA